MRLKKSRVKAFTLLECLVALLVISGSLLVFDGLSRYLAKDITHQRTTKEKDWLVFTEQLRQELDRSQFVKVENDRLYVKKEGQELAFGKSRADDFRKTNWSNQGYQPMLQGLYSATMSLDSGLVRIDFIFEDKMERSFIYAMEETR